jgi:hypothetical protein
MSLSGRELLQHSLDEAEYLSDRSRGLTSEEFLQDRTSTTSGSGARGPS